MFCLFMLMMFSYKKESIIFDDLTYLPRYALARKFWAVLFNFHSHHHISKLLPLLLTIQILM
jgi:hypothetical protein